MNTPFVSLRTTVPEQWIDINGHMNATHFGLIIYDAHVNITEAIGLGEAYVSATQCGKAVLESHLIYEREACLGDELEVRSWLLAVDNKRLHFFHEVYNLSQGFRTAAGEQVDIHIDLKARKSTPMPETLCTKLQTIVRDHLSAPSPAGIGSQLRPPKNHWL